MIKSSSLSFRRFYSTLLQGFCVAERDSAFFFGCIVHTFCWRVALLLYTFDFAFVFHSDIWFCQFTILCQYLWSPDRADAIYDEAIYGLSMACNNTNSQPPEFSKCSYFYILIIEVFVCCTLTR